MKGKIPGTIKAKNKLTGVVFYIRPDMLKIQDHPWILLDEKDKETLTPVTKKKTTDEKPKLILTKDNKPFKTEQAARAAMTTQGLSEDEYVIIQSGDEGFIITKV